MLLGLANFCLNGLMRTRPPTCKLGPNTLSHNHRFLHKIPELYAKHADSDNDENHDDGYGGLRPSLSILELHHAVLSRPTKAIHDR